MSSIHYRKPGHTHTVCGLIANTDKARVRKQDVTCARCRRVLKMGETWAQSHARGLKRKPAKLIEATAHTLKEIARMPVDRLLRAIAARPKTIAAGNYDGPLDMVLDGNPFNAGTKALPGQRFGRAVRIAPKPTVRLADGSYFLNKPMAQTCVDHLGHPDAGVRIFKSTPEHLTLQIRTTGRTGGRGSKPRKCYSSVMLDAGDIAGLIAELHLLLPQIVKS